MDKKYFLVIALLFISARFFHFGSEIDLPHDWRQCDTAHYIRAYYENGVDLLHPSVCWMGNRDTLALEFPLPEAVVALGYHVTGESIPFARIIFLIFFSLSAFYLYRFIHLLWGTDLARISTLVYLAAPLSLFYSRAVHIDFFVIWCTHAMVYYFLRALITGRGNDMLWSSGFATLAFLIKAAYPFYWVIPLLYYTWHLKKLRWLGFRSAVFILPVALFLWWQKQVYTINNSSPDWSYILHYHKMVQSPGWYFGHWAYRLQAYPWYILLQRGIAEVTGFIGIIFFSIGLYKVRLVTHAAFVLAWLAGTLVYILVFFNLNVVHNYYQIPWLAPASLLIAMGISHLPISRGWKVVCTILVIVFNFLYAETHYYQVPLDQVEIGQIIRKNTPDKALVIITYDNMDCRDPRILYRAHRRGWSVEETALNGEVLSRLHTEEGAEYWIYIGQVEPAQMTAALVSRLYLQQTIPLSSVPKTAFIFKIE